MVARVPRDETPYCLVERSKTVFKNTTYNNKLLWNQASQLSGQRRKKKSLLIL